MERLPLGRVASFGVLPLLASIAPFLVIPAIAAKLGAQGWAAIAIGQSVGQMGAIAVAFGWPVLGPASVAGRSSGEQWREFERSLRVRVILYLPIATITWFIATALSPGEFSATAGLSAVAFCVNGLLPSWFFTGTGRARGVVTFESVPRLLSTVVATVLLTATANPMAYPACLLVGSVLGSLGATFSIRRLRDGDQGATVARLGRLLPHVSVMLSSLCAAAYTVGSTAIVSASTSAVAVVAGFAAIFRVQSMARIPAQTLSVALQGWVAEGPSPIRRMRAAFAWMSGISLVLGVVISLLLPTVLHFLFVGTMSTTPLSSILCGVMVAASGMSMAMSMNVLVPTGRAHLISIATVVASCVGVPLLFWTAPVFGVEGAVAALVAAEVVAVIIQLPATVKALSNPLDGGGNAGYRTGNSDTAVVPGIE